MNPYNLKISQLRALVTVADTGNFSQAALQLDLSQSTVSHAIATLEEELGVVLFTRGRQGARLTPVGERVVEKARQVMQLLGGMAKEANREKGLQGGKVRIASFRSVATHILPAAIARFRSQCPQVSVAIAEFDDTTEMEQAVRSGQADIGFTYLPTRDEFETVEILRDDYIALLPPCAELKSAEMTWEQLVSYPLIVSSTQCCFTLVNQFLKHSKIPLNIAYEVREDSTIVSMVMQGLGLAIMPRLAAEPIPVGLQVCSLPAPLERVIGAAILADTLHTPAVFAFLDTLKHTARLKTLKQPLDWPVPEPSDRVPARS